MFNSLPPLIRINLNHHHATYPHAGHQLSRPTSARSSADDLDADDEDRLVIDDSVEKQRDHLNLKENVLNLKSDKPRKKHLRFNGMPEEEVAKKILPDLIREDLDILMVSLIICIRRSFIRQGLLKDGQESFSKIYKLFFRRYMPKPH